MEREGRFKSQALLNEQAMLSCMVYVDLNPIRAKLSDSLEESDFTSIQKRITAYSNEQSKKSSKIKNKSKAVRLADFTEGSNIKEGIPYTLKDYFELADWTGRAIREDKRGYIPDKEPKIIHKLGIDSEIWMDTVKEYAKSYHSFVGSEAQLKKVCESAGKKWLSGMKISRVLFQTNGQIN